MPDGLQLIVAALATWRVTHLLAFEDGPWNVIARLRMHVGGGFWGSLMDCFQCLSLWVAAIATLLLAPSVTSSLFVWLALSGAACLLDRVGHDPVMIHSVDQGGSAHGVLRAEPGESENRDARGSGVGT